MPRAGGEGEAGERGGRVEAANAYFLAGKESGEQTHKIKMVSLFLSDSDSDTEFDQQANRSTISRCF